MTDAHGTAIIARLDAAQARLARLAAGPQPAGATEPSPGGEETWTASQVWGHLAEFPSYWVAALRQVVAAPPDAPASFGRTLTDPSRIEPLAAAADQPVGDLFARCAAGIAEVRVFVRGLSGSDWERVGRHLVRGEITVAQAMEIMLAGHLEEHANQLERLAAAD